VAEQELNAFEARPWGKQYPTSCCMASRLGSYYTFFVLPASIRKVVYTNNAIESINELRKIIKISRALPYQ